MLEEKIRLKYAMQNNEPRYRVSQFFDEYEKAYHRLHNPSEKHHKDYVSLFFTYLDYIKKRGEKNHVQPGK